jgi:hypothetical protein
MHFHYFSELIQIFSVISFLDKKGDISSSDGDTILPSESCFDASLGEKA